MAACGRDPDAPADTPLAAGAGWLTSGGAGVAAGGASGRPSSGAGTNGNGAGSSGVDYGPGAGAGGEAGARSEPAAGRGGAPEVPGPPEVESSTPAAGPYGTPVTIAGRWLGGKDRAGSLLLLGDHAELELEPASTLGVQSWSENQIVVRFPFPARGAIAVSTPEGAVVAGRFEPTWVAAAEAASAPATSVVASLSPAVGTITLLVDTDPPTLLTISPGGANERSVDLGGATLDSVRLYLTRAGVVEGIGVSDGAAPELIHLANVSGNLVGRSTGIALAATETALAGGPDGACAWMRQSAGWMRARPSQAGGWVLDKGPIADPQPNGKNRAAGATSDGSLYVAWAVDAGNFLDDMEAPVMRRLGPADTVFGAQRSAGSNVDDYVTSLTLIDKGRGLVVRYCGSDVDPSGLSGTSYRCYDGLHAQQGGSIARVPVDRTHGRHAFADARAVAATCDATQVFRLRTDADVAPDPAVPAGEAVLYPCLQPMALEVDPEGEFVPVVRSAGLLYLLARAAP